MADYVIVVAGGRGTRMGADVPKQFLPLCGEPVLMHTLRRFRAFSAALQIVLVLPPDCQAAWRALCAEHAFDVSLRVAGGGANRFESVRNGLALVPAGAGLVAVHDGVRPFPSSDALGRVFGAARACGAAVPVMPVVETLRHKSGRTVPRSDYRLVQTPQVFDAQLLKNAYEQPFSDDFTDDASVVERFGHPVTMVDGNRENIKITTPFDLALAELLVRSGA